HHREFQREAAGLVHAALDVLGQLAERRIAGRELGPGVAAADHRAAVEHLVRQAPALEPAAVVEPLLAVAAGPLLAAAWRFGWSAHAVGDPAREEGVAWGRPADPAPRPASCRDATGPIHARKITIKPVAIPFPLSVQGRLGPSLLAPAPRRRRIDLPRR